MTVRARGVEDSLRATVVIVFDQIRILLDFISIEPKIAKSIRNSQIAGMDIIDSIAMVKTGRGDRPEKDVIMNMSVIR